MKNVPLLEFQDLPVGSRFVKLEHSTDGNLQTCCKVWRKTGENFAVNLLYKSVRGHCRVDPDTLVVEFKDQRGGLDI